MKLGFRERERYSKYFWVVLTLARKIYETVGGWAPLRCSLQSVPPPATDNQGVWGSEGGGGGGWPRPGPLLSSSSPCHFHVSLLCSSYLTEYAFLSLSSSLFSCLFSSRRYPSPFLSTLSSTNYLRRWRSSSSALRIAISPVLCIWCTLSHRFIPYRSSSTSEEVSS